MSDPNASGYVAVFKLNAEFALAQVSSDFFDKVNILVWVFL